MVDSPDSPPPEQASPPAANAVSGPGAAPKPGDKTTFYVLVGMVLLVLPLLILTAGLGVYVYLQSDSILDTFQQVKAAEDEAAARAEKARRERQAQLLAEFHDAFDRENLTIAAAVLQRMETADVDDLALKACRDALKKAEARVAEQDATPVALPPDDPAMEADRASK